MLQGLSNGNSYTYDANGNQIKRTIGSNVHALEYDAENRLVKVCQDTSNNGACDSGETVIASFVYDGDGRQVKSTVNGVVTTFVGAHYQIVNGTVTKYYFAGASRIAMRTGSTVTYLLGDHLGSTSLTTDALGNLVSELRYKPWDETRYSSGTTATSYRYTGQREEVSFGLYFYNARWYDPALGRFAQADSIVPGGVQGLDRYAYVNNSPLVYVDPSGHTYMCGASCEEEYEKPQYSLDDWAKDFGITFTGGDKYWTWDKKAAVLVAAYKVGKALQKEINAAADSAYQTCVANMSGPTSSCSQSAQITSSEAFRAVYDHVNFKWEGSAGMCGSDAVSSGGCTDGAHQIRFWSMSGQGQLDFSRMIKNVVHELGHAFDWTQYDPLTKTRASNHMPPGFTRSTILRPNDPAGRWDWQQSPRNTSNEIFGDMFIAWTYGAWNTDPLNVTTVNAAQGWMNGLVP